MVTDCPEGKVTSVRPAERVTAKPLYFTVTGHGNGFFPLSTTSREERIALLERIMKLGTAYEAAWRQG